MKSYPKEITDIQNFINSHQVLVEFNDGTQAQLDINHISANGIAAKHREFIKKI